MVPVCGSEAEISLHPHIRRPGSVLSVLICAGHYVFHSSFSHIFGECKERIVATVVGLQVEFVVVCNLVVPVYLTYKVSPFDTDGCVIVVSLFDFVIEVVLLIALSRDEFHCVASAVQVK